MSKSLKRFRPQFETLEAREVLTEYMAVSLVATDLAGVQITSVAAGQAFNLQIVVDDLRHKEFAPANYIPDPSPTPDPALAYYANPYGVASAYVDLFFVGSAFNFDANSGPKPGPGAPSILNPTYDAGKSSDGVIEELGSVQGVTAQGNGDPRVWMTVPMIAESSLGSFEFRVQHPVINEGFANTDEGNAAALSFIKSKSSALLKTGATALNPNEINYSGATITLKVVEAGDPVDIDLRVVKTKTVVNSSGEVSTLPQNAAWLDEWDQFYVEIYATAPEGAYLKSVSVAIDFTNEFHNVVQVIDSTKDATLKFAASNVTYNNNTNRVTATFSTAFNGLGDNNTPALIGRIYFGPDINPGTGVDLVASGDYPEAETTAFALANGGGATVQYSESTGTTGLTVGASAATDIYAVPYDLDDDGSISLIDLTQVIRKIGSTVTPANNLYGMDFSHNGFIDLIDMSMLIKNIGISRNILSSRSYYPGFPFASSSAMGMIEGESNSTSSALVLEGESVSSEEISASFEETSRVSDPTSTPTYYPLITTSTTNSPSQSQSTPSEDESPTEELILTNGTTGGDSQAMLIIDAADNLASDDLAADSEAVDEVFADLELDDLHLTM